jgi:putative transcriptional regulator
MKKEMFEELLTSIRQGGAILKGKMKPARIFNLKNPDIKGIRGKLKLSQDQFARLMGISLGTLRNWEQGHRKPHGPARVLLGVAAIHPEVFADVVGIKTRTDKQRMVA